MKEQIKTGHRSQAAVAQRGLLALMLAAGVIGTGVPAISHAQATNGSIVGHAPAGDRVVVQGAGGVERGTTVKNNGNYALRGLPLGVYTVTLFQNDNELDARYDIRLRPGGHYKVDFSCDNNDCTKQAKAGKG